MAHNQPPSVISEEPLLPECQNSTKPNSTPTASVFGALFNLSTSMIGAGIMSMPATLKVLGILPALALIVVVAFLCDISVEFLLRHTAPAPGSGGAGVSYAGVMKESFGKTGAALLQICVILNNGGCLIIYLIIIGDVLSGTKSGDGAVHLGILQEWFGREQWWNQRSTALLFTLVFVLLPLLSLRRVDSLRFSSAVSVFLAVVFVVISSGIAIYALICGATKTPRLFPDIEHPSPSSFFNLFSAVPVIVVAFTFHFNVHPIRAEMSTASDMTQAVRLSLILCSIIYGSIGFFGYLLFGDATMDDILSNFDATSSSGVQISPFLNDVVRLSYAVHLVLVFPLVFFSLRINIDEIFFPKLKSLITFQQASRRFLAVTVVLAASLYLAAITIPNIWVLFQFFGSTASVCLSLVFPAAIVLRDVHGISGAKDKILAVGMIVLAAATSCIAIASNVINFF